MGSLAMLAKQNGFEVEGCDAKIYPPMSDQLAQAGIRVFEGFDESMLQPPPDTVIIGNANQPRGVPAVEYILNEELNYTSAAAWLGEVLLDARHVIAVAGTHGKTTTSSMIAWILEFSGKSPGYLIGGVPTNFGRSADLGKPPFFVVEADEYDTSYFDRRSKFIHYRPNTLVINNIEFDHADIFDDLEAIKFQFHHLIRTVPGKGRIIVPTNDPNVHDTLQRGCWSPLSYCEVNSRGEGKDQPKEVTDIWRVQANNADFSEFSVHHNGEEVGSVAWCLQGVHNGNNAIASIAAAAHVGVSPQDACDALSEFTGVKRRMEVIADDGMLTVYDDFAHHPTAIRKTLEGLRKHVGEAEVVAVVEPRTHTMSLGTLQNDLKTCAKEADRVYWFKGEQIQWDIESVALAYSVPSIVTSDLAYLVDEICTAPNHRRHVVLMSNGSFGGIYDLIRERLEPSKPV